jgi:hypothetical protein
VPAVVVAWKAEVGEAHGVGVAVGHTGLRSRVRAGAGTQCQQEVEVATLLFDGRTVVHVQAADARGWGS